MFKDKGFSNITSNEESGGTFLVGYKGHLYTIFGDFQVAEMSDGFESVVCGESFALGSMAALAKLKPETRIKKSLEIAAYFSAGVCGPFSVRSMKRETKEK